MRTVLNLLAFALFTWGGALLFSTGLGTRLRPGSVPSADILGPTGTRPGWILGGVAGGVLLACVGVNEATVRSRAWNGVLQALFAVAVGGLAFAAGATNLANVNAA